MKSDSIRTLLVLAAFAAAGTSFAAEPAAGIPIAVPAAQVGHTLFALHRCMAKNTMLSFLEI